MRNQYPGPCYRCGTTVEANKGHFERHPGPGPVRWRVQHAECAIEHRGTPDPVREQASLRRDNLRALGTGRRAQRARKRLRDMKEKA